MDLLTTNSGVKQISKCDCICTATYFVKKKLLKSNLNAHYTSKFCWWIKMFNQNEQIESVTFQALAHPIRRTIIRIVNSRSQGISYTELITELGLSTGKLNYHLEQLKGILEKNSSNYYVLTPFGKKAVDHLNLIREDSNTIPKKQPTTHNQSFSLDKHRLDGSPHHNLGIHRLHHINRGCTHNYLYNIACAVRYRSKHSCPPNLCTG